MERSFAAEVKGYGEVRRRLSRALERVLDEVLAPAMARDRDGGRGYARATAIVREARRRLLEEDKGVEAVLGPVGYGR
jgi:hypothetical protein